MGIPPHSRVREKRQKPSHFFDFEIQMLMVSVRPFGVSLFAGIVALVVGGASCSMLSNSEPKASPSLEFHIAQVDSLHFPEVIAPSDTLNVEFYGTVGPDGCHSFARFDVEASQRQLTITPVVRHVTSENAMCTMAIVPLNHTFTADPPFSEGALTLAVPQPNGEEIRAVVNVEKGAS